MPFSVLGESKIKRVFYGGRSYCKVLYDMKIIQIMNLSDDPTVPMFPM